MDDEPCGEFVNGTDGQQDHEVAGPQDRKGQLKHGVAACEQSVWGMELLRCMEGRRQQQAK